MLTVLECFLHFYKINIKEVWLAMKICPYPFSVKYALVRSFSEVKLRKINN